MFVKGLKCTCCGVIHQLKPPKQCPECGEKSFRFQVVYDYEKLSQLVHSKIFKRHIGSMWKYRELLPVINEKCIVSLGEGWTPLLRSEHLRIGGCPLQFQKR